MIAHVSNESAEQRVVVLAYGESFKFVSWFLQQSGIANTRVTELPAAEREVSSGRGCVLVINSRENSARIAPIVALLRRTKPDLFIISLRDGRHPAGDPPIDANVCMHDSRDPDDLASIVRMVFADYP